MRKEVDQYIELSRKFKKALNKQDPSRFALYHQCTKIYNKLDDKERNYAQKALRGEVLEGLGAQGQMIDTGDEVSIIQKAISKLPSRVQALIKPEQKYKVVSALGDTATLAVSGMKINLPTSFLNKPITWEEKIPSGAGQFPKNQKQINRQNAYLKTIKDEKLRKEVKKCYLAQGDEDENYWEKHQNEIVKHIRALEKLEEPIQENTMKIKKSTLKEAIHEAVLVEVTTRELDQLKGKEIAMRYKKVSTGEVKTYFGRVARTSGENVYVGCLGKGLRAFRISNIQNISPANLKAEQIAELDEMCGSKKESALSMCKDCGNPESQCTCGSTDEVINEAKKRKFQKVTVTGRRKYETQATVHRVADRMAAAKKKNKNEACPPGFSGTVKAMKKHPEFEKECAILEKINPYALAWWMKNKGYKSHKTTSGKNK